MDKIRIEKEVELIKLELGRVNQRLDEIYGTVKAIALDQASGSLEPLSDSSLNQLSADSNANARILSKLPDWATKTYVAVKEICVEGMPATAIKVATLTKKKRNTESSRLAMLASLGLLVRERKGRYVKYTPKT